MNQWLFLKSVELAQINHDHLVRSAAEQKGLCFHWLTLCCSDSDSSLPSCPKRQESPFNRKAKQIEGNANHWEDFFGGLCGDGPLNGIIAELPVPCPLFVKCVSL